MKKDISHLDVHNMKRDAIITCIACSGFIFLMVIGSGCIETAETACGALPGDDRDHCLQKLAVTSGNLKLCEKIEGAGPATKCLALVAKDTGVLVGCEKMEEDKWSGNREAYHSEDCVMLVAIDAKCPKLCQILEEDFHGQATDLNPHIDVTRENCLKNIQCGASGQPACRGISGNVLLPEGNSQAYNCGNVYYPTLVTCP